MLFHKKGMLVVLCKFERILDGPAFNVAGMDGLRKWADARQPHSVAPALGRDGGNALKGGPDATPAIQQCGLPTRRTQGVGYCPPISRVAGVVPISYAAASMMALSSLPRI